MIERQATLILVQLFDRFFVLVVLIISLVFIFQLVRQIVSNWRVYREIRLREIPRQTGMALWWIIFTAPDQEALFDALNVSHVTRQSITFVEKMMSLSPENRRRVMRAFKPKDDEHSD